MITNEQWLDSSLAALEALQEIYIVRHGFSDEEAEIAAYNTLCNVLDGAEYYKGVIN